MHHASSRVRLLSRHQSGHTVIAVRGELDIATTASLRDRILIMLKDTTSLVIVDLSGVTFCDASGLALLVGTRRRAALHGLTVTLAAPRPNVAKLLRVTGLNRAFTVHPTLTSALLDRTPAHQLIAA
jgi:anti-anti-sigma factor